MVPGREPSSDNKEAQCRTAVQVDKEHGNRSIRNRHSKDLKSAIYLMKWSEGRTSKEDENVGSEHKPED
jgi:hypothetical protein